MAIIEITYDAKCKHCRFFKYRRLPNKNGEMSKRMYAYCENPKSEREEHPLTLKTLACDKIEL